MYEKNNSHERSGQEDNVVILNHDAKNIPELRFSEFEGEWEERRLGQISSIHDGTHGTHENVERGKYLLSAENIEQGKVNIKKESRIISNEDFDKIHKNYFIKNDDVLLTIVGTIGRTAIVKNYNKEYTFQRSVAIINTNINSYYLNYFIQTSSVQKELKIRTNSSAQGGIYLKELSKIKIKIPSNAEQEKIADFLSAVDKKIEFMEIRLKHLINLKKNYMEKIFSEDNIFNIQWDTIKLKELLVKSKAGGTPKSTEKQYYGGTIPFLSINDMTKQGKYINKTEKYITDTGLNNSSAWLVPENSLLYSMYASVGFVAINKIKLSTSQAIYSMIIKNNTSLEFLYYYLLYYQRFVYKYVETGTQGNLNAKIVKNLPVLITSLSNQEKISTFLSNIDKKINLMDKKIKLNKEFKRTLLNKMFCK